MRKSLFQQGFAVLGIVMVVATITLIGIVAFRVLDAQDNTQVADTSTQQTDRVASVESAKDVDTATSELDNTELDSLDTELDAEFNF